jgi:hypothetical protein
MAFLYVPGISHLLGQQGLTAHQWLPILAAPVLLVAAEEGRKALVRTRARRRASATSSPTTADAPPD